MDIKLENSVMGIDRLGKHLVNPPKYKDDPSGQQNPSNRDANMIKDTQ